MIQSKDHSKINRNKKQELTEMMVSSLEKMRPDQQLVFLTGYICPIIGLLPDLKSIEQLQRVIFNLGQKIQQQLISFTNFVQIIVETLQHWKIDKKLNGSQICTRFDAALCQLCGELACSRRYLRQKWFKESKMESEVKSFMDMQEQKYRNNGKMQEEQSLKLIMKLQQEQNLQRQRRRKEMEEQSEKYLKQLLKQQEEKDRKRKEMIQKMQKQSMTCEICVEQIPYVDAGTLSCGHIFHKSCIRSHIQSLVKDKKIDIPCPSACGKNMPLEDIEEYIDGDLKQKFQKFCFDIYVQKNDKLVSWCPSPGCTAVFTIQGGLDNYKCPVCTKHYCLACRCEYHRGMSCAEYRINNSYGEDDRKFEQFVRGAKFKQCPKCKYWVERVEGCSTMSCRCGHEFCYDCGGSDCPHGMCKNIAPGGGGGGVFPIFGRRRRR